MTYVDQFARHVNDLATDTFEGRNARSDRFAHFLVGIELATPVVLDVLESINNELLLGSGDLSWDPMPDDVMGNCGCRWMLSWPLQRSSRHRVTEVEVGPVVIAVAFPRDYTHPHLGESNPADSESIWAWPFQVSTAEDVEGLRFIFEAIAVASLHERIFQADIGWRILPSVGQPTSLA